MKKAIRTNAQLHSRANSAPGPATPAARSIQPPPHSRSQNTSRNASSTTSSAPSTGAVSQPNAGSALCAFRSLRVISALRPAPESVEGEESVRGGENWSVAERGASERVKPALEKSDQERVSRLARRSWERG